MTKTRKIGIGVGIAVAMVYMTLSGRMQTPPTFSIEPRGKDEFEKKKKPFKINNTTFGVSKYESPNGQTLIEQASFGNTTTLTTEFETKRFGNYELKFEGTIVAPKTRELSETYSILAITATKKLKKFDVALMADYFRSERFSFGILGLKASKEVTVKKNIRLTPYGILSYYTPTESSNNHVTPGWVMRAGLKTDLDYRDTVFEFNNQGIADSGALFTEKRTGFISDGSILFPLPGFRVGPMLGYKKFSHGESGGLYGFAFRLGR